MKGNKEIIAIAGGENTKLEPVVKVRRSQTGSNNNDVIEPPVDFDEIIQLSYANAYHGRCVEIKVHNLIDNLQIGETETTFFEDRIEEDTLLEFLEKILTDYFLLGNSYLEHENSNIGDLVGLYHVPGQTMRSKKRNFLQITEEKEIQFRKFGSGALNEIMQIRKANVLSTAYGYPTWLPSLEALRIDLKVKQFNSSFFNNSARPDMAVVMEGADFSAPAKQAIKEALSQTKGPENAGKTLLLGVPFENAKIKFEPLTSSLKDIDFSKLSNSTRDEIIAAHGVPPRMLGIMQSGQLGGGGEGESQLKTFFQTVISPEGKHIAAKLNKILKKYGMKETIKMELPAFLQEKSGEKDPEERKEEAEKPEEKTEKSISKSLSPAEIEELLWQ